MSSLYFLELKPQIAHVHVSIQKKITAVVTMIAATALKIGPISLTIGTKQAYFGGPFSID